MKLSRDYLLGLGTGLVLSATLLLGAYAGESALTNKNRTATENPNQTAGLNGENIEPPQNETPTQNQASTQNETSILNAMPSQSTTIQNPATVQEPVQPVEDSTKTSAIVTVTIPNGASAETIAALLADRGIITDKKAFLDTVKKQNLAAKFHVGTFAFPAKITMDELMSILTK